jgi:hypothetical protein
MTVQIARDHLTIDAIEKRGLIAGDKQGPIPHRDPNIIGFGSFHADR